MLIFAPIHSAVPSMTTFAADLKRRGKLTDHTLRLCSRKEDEELCYELGDQLSDHFLKVSTQTLPEKKRSAIQLSNEMFSAMFMFLRSYQAAPGELQNPPCLFMDPGYRPASSGWVDAVQAEFFLKQSPASLGRTLPGKEPKSRVYVGPVLFAKKFAGDLETLGLLDDRTPWRERLQWLLAKDSVETKLIGAGSKSVIKPKS